MILAITGYKRHGKDTVAQMVQEMAPGFGLHPKRIAFADPLKRITRDLYGLSEGHTDGALKEEHLPEWGKTPRQIMQLLGTEVARAIHPETWIRYLVAQTRRGPNLLWIVSDLRFMNEAEALHAEGATIWRVTRPALGENTDPHPSEADIPKLPVHLDLVNRDLTELRESVRDALRQRR